jgi:hypothetical protein
LRTSRVLVTVVVFVPDLAEDLLDDVLDGDDAGGAAVLVDDEDELGSGGRRTRLRTASPLETRPARWAPAGPASRTGGGGALGRGDREGVLDVDDADGLVEVTALTTGNRECPDS